MKIVCAVILFCLTTYCYSQPNCSVFKEDKSRYQACLVATEAAGLEQGSKQSQLLFEKAIELCPTFDYAYMEKSVPFLKRGDLITWKKLIDQAVELNPLGHLGYRGWCRFQFLRDYEGAINDIEKLDSLTRFDIGYSQNGDYHLNVARALCYKSIGKPQKAIEIIERQLSEKGYSPMTYDYFHLGVLNMEIGNTERAIEYLKKSISFNNYLAEPYYYLGLIQKKKGEKKDFVSNMEKARAYYLKGYKRFDPYTNPIDKIYLSDIEDQLQSFKQ